MSKQTQIDWNESNIIDDVAFQEEDAKQFKNLLNRKEEAAGEGSVALMSSGQILKGRIVEITKDFVVVDVGLKSEGLVPINEFSDPTELILGNEVEVYLDQAEDEDGQIVLSREKARRQRQWEYIVNHCEEGSIVKGKVIRKVKGGLMVDIGMEAFLPGSQIDNKRIKNLDEFIDQILRIQNPQDQHRAQKYRRFPTRTPRRRAHLQQSRNAREHQRRRCPPRHCQEHHRLRRLPRPRRHRWPPAHHRHDMEADQASFRNGHLGQELEVMILHVDKEKGRVALGMKQKESNPWEEIEKRYPPGTRVKGKIVNLVPYGAFIEIEPGIEGLIHVSEMSWVKNITDPSEIVKKGDEVEAIVLSVQKEEGKISLGHQAN